MILDRVREEFVVPSLQGESRIGPPALIRLFFIPKFQMDR
jgi:hypothetical protein